MFTFKDSKQATLPQTNLSWETAVAKALESATREYDATKDPQLYMYNPVGSDPLPLDVLEHALETTGTARIEAGHYIQLLITLNGCSAWQCEIYRAD